MRLFQKSYENPKYPKTQVKIPLPTSVYVFVSLTCELIIGQERHEKMFHPAQLSGYGSPQIVPTEH